MGFWYGKRVLVTGAHGLIGGPLCKALLQQGARVTGYDLGTVPSTLGAHGIEGAFPLVKGDICDLQAVQTALDGQEVCFHLAAVSGVEHARELAFQAWEVNVRGTYTVLEACRTNGELAAVAVASSNHIYGKQRWHPTQEDAPQNQIDTYSATKIAADVAARSYAHNYGLPVVVVRNTNCYGVGDPHRDHIIPGTIAAVLQGRPPVIHSDGLRRKAYLYVDDVADAYLRLAEHIALGGKAGEAFNVSGNSIRVRDLLQVILAVMDSDLTPIVNNEPNDQQDEELDWRKVNAITGWRPLIPLAEGIRRTAAWLADELKVSA